MEGEDGETPKTKKRHRRKAKKKTGIYDLYEPSELERGHFLERDAEIRVTDMPERFQTRSIPVKPSEEGELEEEAEWVFEHAFVKFPISKQVQCTFVGCVYTRGSWSQFSRNARINVHHMSGTVFADSAGCTLKSMRACIN